jgi:hypothetical protein
VRLNGLSHRRATVSEAYHAERIKAMTKQTQSNNNIVGLDTAQPVTSPMTSAGAPDFFDLNKLKLDQSFVEMAGVKKLLTTVPVGKPGPQDFIRVRHEENYRETFALIELHEDREYYVLQQDIARTLPGEYFLATVFTCVNRAGVVRLVPVKLPGPDGRINVWHQSMMDGITAAMAGWVRVKANMALGAYETFQATGTIPDPDWPEAPFEELLRIGFRGRIVDRLDHPLIQRLRGG